MPPKRARGKAKQEQEALGQKAREEKKRLLEALDRLNNSACILGGFAGPHGPAQSRTTLIQAEECVKSGIPRNKYSTAEIPPAWTEGPSLETPRWCFGAANLGHGRVLIAGGFDEFGLPLASTELVDLVGGTSKPGPKLKLPRAGCAAVAMPLPFKHKDPDEDSDKDSDDSEEEQQFDENGLPVQKKPWTPWVLILGGYGPDAGQSTEVLDLEAMTSDPGPMLLQPRACCGVCMYDKKRLLVAGGFDRIGSTSTTEFLDFHALKPTYVAEPAIPEEEAPAPTDAEAPEETPAEALAGTTAEVDNAGQELTIGDSAALPEGEKDEQAAAEEDDESEHEWKKNQEVFTGPEIPEDVARAWFVPGPPMLEKRGAFALVFMPDREPDIKAKLFVIGGMNEAGKRLQSTEWLEIRAPESQELEEDPEQVESAKGGEAVAGGEAAEAPGPEAAPADAPLAEAQAEEDEEDEEEEEEKPLAFEPGPLMKTARSGFGAVRMNSMFVVVSGGLGDDGSFLESSEYYTPETDEFKPGPSLSWIGEEREDGKYGGFSHCAGSRMVSA